MNKFQTKLNTLLKDLQELKVNKKKIPKIILSLSESESKKKAAKALKFALKKERIRVPSRSSFKPPLLLEYKPKSHIKSKPHIPIGVGKNISKPRNSPVGTVTNQKVPFALGQFISKPRNLPVGTVINQKVPFAVGKFISKPRNLPIGTVINQKVPFAVGKFISKPRNLPFPPQPTAI